LAAAPWLFRRPLDNVVAVPGLGAEWIPLPFTLVAAADVRVDDGIPHARERDQPVVDARVLTLHAVRGADNDGRDTPLARRPVDGSVDGHAVAQANGLVVIDQNAFGEGRGALDEQHRGGEDQAGEHGCVPPRSGRGGRTGKKSVDATSYVGRIMPSMLI